jgi:hypothetical protein
MMQYANIEWDHLQSGNSYGGAFRNPKLSSWYDLCPRALLNRHVGRVTALPRTKRIVVIFSNVRKPVDTVQLGAHQPRRCRRRLSYACDGRSLRALTMRRKRRSRATGRVIVLCSTGFGNGNICGHVRPIRGSWEPRVCRSMWMPSFTFSLVPPPTVLDTSIRI